MKTFLWIVCAMTWFPLPLQAAAPDAPADTVYQEALFKETTARDLMGAITLYQKVVEQRDASRTLQANAYLRLGSCQRTLGHNEEAKQAWNKVVQEYGDQPAAYQDAKNDLQELMAETQKSIVQVQASTPTVIYAPPPTRWAFEWLDMTFYHTVDRKGSFLNYYEEGSATNLPHSLEYYLSPTLAIGIEGRRLFSSYQVFVDNNGFSYYQYTEIRRSVAYIAPVARLEKRLRFGLTPYAKLGPAAYRFHFDGDFGSSTKWSPGITSEAGITMGWPRGFTLSAGYSLLGFVQQTPSIDLTGLQRDYTHAAPIITQGHGWRWMGGPSFKLGFRW